jgi:hypothetical protein
MKKSIIAYVYYSIIDYMDITLYRKYISNLKSTNDNNKLPKKNIHNNYLTKKVFSMISNLKYKGGVHIIDT